MKLGLGLGLRLHAHDGLPLTVSSSDDYINRHLANHEMFCVVFEL